MNISNLIIYFITGGLFTTIIVALEESGYRTLSGLATLIPVFTLVAYFFIGRTQRSEAVSQHAKVGAGRNSCIMFRTCSPSRIFRRRLVLTMQF